MSEATKKMVFVLGTWHIYKQATCDVWRLAAAHFLAPLWHELYQSDAFTAKPKLIRASHFLTIIRVAIFCSDQASELQSQLARACEAQKNPVESAHLSNLKALLCFLIPAVRPNDASNPMLFRSSIFHASPNSVESGVPSSD